MGRVNTLKFSESGVRGIVGEGLTPRLVTELGAAFGFYQGGGRIVVGRDTRATGAMFEDALGRRTPFGGLSGRELGVVPTPTIQFTVTRTGASGAVAITASHNPASGTRSNSSAAAALSSTAARLPNFSTSTARGACRAAGRRISVKCASWRGRSKNTWPGFFRWSTRS